MRRRVKNIDNKSTQLYRESGVSTSLELGRKFQQLSSGDDSFDVQTYQQSIGCLTYMSTATRPDIAAAVESYPSICQSQKKTIERVLNVFYDTSKENFELWSEIHCS